MTVTSYGDISPRTAAYAVAQMLKRGLPYLCLEKFGQTYPLPKNNTKVAKFRRYFLSGSTGAAGNTGTTAPLNSFYTLLATTPLVEGVTPTGRQLANQDYTVTLAQYGDFVTITDVIMDTHEDRVLQQATDILGEQAAQTVETLRYNVLKAGVNVFYSTGSSRAAVRDPITLTLQRQVTAALQRQNARMITQVVKSTPDFRTEPVEAAYIGYCHPDVENDIRNATGFIPTKQYGTVTSYENELGAIERVRYLTSTIAASITGAAGVTGNFTTSSAGAAIINTSSYVDVYPVLYLARDAFGLVPLKGENSLSPMVVNPKPAPGDPLAQRGTVGWKTYHASVILNDAWMARLEVAALS